MKFKFKDFRFRKLLTIPRAVYFLVGALMMVTISVAQATWVAPGHVSDGTPLTTGLWNDLNDKVSELSAATGTNNPNEATSFWQIQPSSPAWIRGYLKLKTPINYKENNGFSIKISGYRYGIGGKPVEITCSGYAYNPATTGLIQTGCYTEGTSDPVGIGVDTDNTIMITIGSLNNGNIWYWDHFTVHYSGDKPHSGADFTWSFHVDENPTTVNTNNVFVNDETGDILANGGVLGINNDGDSVLNLNKRSGTMWNYISMYDKGVRKWWFGTDIGGNFGIMNDNSSKGLTVNSTDGVVNAINGLSTPYIVNGTDDDPVIAKPDGGAGQVAVDDPFYVSNNAYINGELWYNTLTAASDGRWKKDVKPLTDSLSKVIKLQGVDFYWNTKDFPDKNFNNTKQIGFIAQEVRKIVPEVVSVDQDGFQGVSYEKLTPVLVEAIKEQNKILNDQQKQIDELIKQINELLKK